MEQIPHELKYTATHEWIRDNQDGTYTVGISYHAQNLLGDIVYVELPQIGDEFEANQECGVVESVKAASDIYCPMEGEVIAINEALEEQPEIVNNHPYEEGWLFRIKPVSDNASQEELLDADAYQEMIQDSE